MKILVTGGAGFIGSHLVDRLIEEGYGVVIIDNLSTGKKDNLNSKAKFYESDIRDPKIYQIFEKEKPEIVFHYAARVNVRESIEKLVSGASVNIIGSLNVLENCKKYNIKKVIFASSGGEIYGDAIKIPTPESYLACPISPYGIGKLTIERYLESYFRLFRIPYLSLRYSNVYGPRQNHYTGTGVIAIFTYQMLRNKPPLIHGSGRQTKDYIFIQDAIEATILSFKKNITGILNIGTGRETSVLEIFYRLKRLIHSHVKEKYGPSPLCSFKRCCLSINKAKKILDWYPRVSLTKGLQETVNWFKKFYNY
ncbi:NAD-dependent epimerase/dehydratase family protein [bacterium]|nr:NAD-dependent epimerase/dehydratase family protein [bacterium]